MTHDLTHDAFAALLPDALDKTLAANARARFEAHRAACAACAALHDDLVAIRDGASALPAHRPERELWEGIEARITTTVLPLPAGPAAGGDGGAAAGVPAAGRRSTRFHPRLVVAAAVLMAATAGLTWQVARRQGSPGGAPALPPAAGGAMIRPVTDPGAATEQAHDREIAALRALLDQRRAELDAATVAVLERNLQVIDAAIAESRAALASDPTDPFLTRRLTDALGTKVELLRGAATLPARS